LIRVKNIKNLLSNKDLTKWERDFLHSLVRQVSKSKILTQKQKNKYFEIQRGKKKEKDSEDKTYKKITIKNEKTKVNIPEEILNELNEQLSTFRGFNVYLYGSHVYGTASKGSDYDFLVILRDEEKVEQYISDTIDITYVHINDFLKNIGKGDINYIEALKNEVYSSKDLSIKIKFNPRFIHSTMDKCYNSYRKGISYTKSKDESKVYRGKKSLFHSVRMMSFFRDLVKYEEISFSAANIYYYDIMENEVTHKAIKNNLSYIKKEIFELLE
tara:strand:- start:102 stop:914 length:813 start_codon:yes stop_codon:yes gene_type:complete